MSTASNTTAPYVEPVIRSMIDMVQFGNTNSNDITFLSALPYLPAAPPSPFSDVAKNSAIAVVSSSTVEGAPPPNTMDGANPEVASAVAETLWTNLGGKVSDNSMTLDDVTRVFFKAGTSGIFVPIAKMLTETTGRTFDPRSSVLSRGGKTGSSGLTLVGLMDAIHAACLKTPFPTDPNSALDDLRKSTLDVVSATVATFSTPFDSDTVDAIATFGIWPWQCLRFAMHKAANPKISFVTRAYARSAAAFAASVAIQKIRNALPDTSAHSGPMSDLADAVGALVNTDLPSLEGPVSAIALQASANRAATLQLQSDASDLEQRSSRAGNLQVTFNVDEDDVKDRKRVFMAWLAAYILVVVASVYLIFTDKIGAFFALAAVTLVLTTLYLLYLWLKSIRWIRANF